MQPYFFPYLGYFDLINYTDEWIVFDTVQYIRHGWINRNRILHPGDGWQYIVVPVRKHKLNILIKDVEPDNSQSWSERVIGQLMHYRRTARYFDNTMAIIKDCLAYRHASITGLNIKSLELVCEYLGISFKWKLFSEMNIDMRHVDHPGAWALEISRALGAQEYANLPGGKSLFNANDFIQNGIELTFRNMPSMMYSCRGYTHVPNLSVIDAMMWNSPADIKNFLDSWREQSNRDQQNG